MVSLLHRLTTLQECCVTTQKTAMWWKRMIFSDRRKDKLLDPALKVILIDIIITSRSVFSSILRFSTPWKRRRRGGEGGRGWVCILVSFFFLSVTNINLLLTISIHTLTSRNWKGSALVFQEILLNHSNETDVRSLGGRRGKKISRENLFMDMKA